MRKRHTGLTLVLLFLLLSGLLLLLFVNSKNESQTKIVTETSASSQQPKSSSRESKIYAWDKPSEETYPTITHPSKLAVEVSIDKQRVFIKEEGKIIYTMVCSTGDSSQGNDTPKGQFVIEAERFKENYWPEYNDWAFNLVSFSGHGIYLFHSVLMLDKDTVEMDEAVKLGHEASHGCVRLPLPDSKWFYDNIPVGTPVTIY